MTAINISREYWSCTRKLRYTHKAAMSVSMKNPELGLRIYRCEYAVKPHWHITHTTAPKRLA